MSQNKSDEVLNCPNCESDNTIIRIKRTFLHRLISIVIPIRRYECYYCGWQGVVSKQKVEVS